MRRPMSGSETVEATPEVYAFTDMVACLGGSACPYPKRAMWALTEST